MTASSHAGPVRIGIIGMGNAGMMHARELVAGRIPGAVLTAVCDRPERLAQVRGELPADVAFITDPETFPDPAVCDAVAVTTPHYQHPELVIRALRAGCHVFCEKPAGVRASDARRMNRAAARSGRVFAMNFNRRLEPVWLKLKQLVDAGALGTLRRVQWTSTDWFRTDGYYASAGWRGTWAGEGGGLLLNQCIHILDLWQHFFGMPRRVRAFCGFGKYHRIEVEDEVTAYFEHPYGLTGVWIAGTAESPGTNRLEIAADHGRLVAENRTLRWWRTAEPVQTFLRTAAGTFGEPECWTCDIPAGGQADLSGGTMKNFVAAIRDGAPLLIPGPEGLRSLEIANAILLSAWSDDWARVPVDARRFDAGLAARVTAAARSARKRPRHRPTGIADLRDSFK